MATVIDEKGPPRSLAGSQSESGTSAPASAVDIATGSLPPGWLTSGVSGLAAGSVFGPVGGLAGFLLASVAHRQRRNTIIDQVASDQSIGEQVSDRVRSSIRRSMELAETDLDRAQFENMLDSQEQLEQLMGHHDPRIRQQALGRMIGMADTINAELGDIEDTAIAAQTAERESERAMFGRFNSLTDDLNQQSQTFIDSRENFGRMLAAAQNGSPAGDIALIFNYMKMLDPGSTVMPGEQALARNAGGIDERLRAFYNSVLDGTTLTDDQRLDFINRARAIYSVARSEQVRRNSNFLERARDQRVADELLDTLPVPLDPGELGFLPPANEAQEVIDEDGDFEIIETDATESGIARAGRSFIEFIDRIAMAARGEQVATDGDRWVVVDSDGNVVRELDGPPLVSERELRAKRISAKRIEDERKRRELEAMTPAERLRRPGAGTGIIPIQRGGGRPTNGTRQ